MKTLVLVGHGSVHDERARRPVADHADTLRDAGPFETVREAFIKGEPALEDVIASVDTGTLVVVPLLATDGYFAGTVIPDILDSHRDRRDIHYTAPVGTHKAMTDVALQRIEAALGGMGEEGQIGIALVGHGSQRHPDSSTVVRDFAAQIREFDRFAEVRSFFLEEPPPVEAATQDSAAECLVVVPVFMVEGYHVRKDIPKHLGLCDNPIDSAGMRVRLVEPVGTHPAVTDIALDRAMTALDEQPTEGRVSGPQGKDRRFVTGRETP